MVADTFYDGADTRIAHAETLAGHTADVSFAVCAAIQRYIADDNVLLGTEGARWQDRRSACRLTGLCQSSRWHPLPVPTSGPVG